MYCIKCGELLSDDARFCRKCGTMVQKISDVRAIKENEARFSEDDAVNTDDSAEVSAIEATNRNMEPIEASRGKIRVDGVVQNPPHEAIEEKMPVVTYILMGICILIAFIVYLKTGSFDPDVEELWDFGASSSFVSCLSDSDERWRLLSSTFLHTGIKHLLCNMACLFSFGVLLERLLGHLKLLEVFFIAAVLSEAFSSKFYFGISVGASGAVFGLFGASVSYLALVWKKCGYEKDGIFSYMKSGLVFVALNFIYGFFPGVNMMAHIGGILVGLLIGALAALPVFKPEDVIFKGAIHIVAGSVVIYLILPWIDSYAEWVMMMDSLQE